MSVGLREVRSEEINAELQRALVPRLVRLLSEREPGHCMRVGGLDVDLMVDLCRAIRAEMPRAQVHVLVIEPLPLPLDVAVTATKLVELRNPLANGSQRPPLLLFVPEEARTSAEDSFGVATFEVLRLGNVYAEVAARLLTGMPNGLRGAIDEVLRRLEAEAWPYADALSVLRYLLTVRVNDNDSDAAGAALFELGLIPDFEAFRDLSGAAPRVLRNLDKMRVLAYSGRSERGRVLELGLASSALRTELAEFVVRTGLIDPRAWARRIVLERNNWRFAFQHWRFAEEDRQEDVFIELLGTSLPRAAGDEADQRVVRLAGHPYLAVGPRGQRSFWVSFRTEPAASLVHGLDRFAAQVFTQDGDRAGVVAVARVGRVAKTEFRATFRRLDRFEWEEGWHYIRVDPLTGEGDPVPLHHPPPGHAAQTAFGAVSELFYVLPETELEVPAPDQPSLRAESLVHAWKDLQFDALVRADDPHQTAPRSVRWKEAVLTGRESRTVQLELRFSGGVAVHVTVPRALRDIERAVLEAPDELATRRLTVDTSGECQATATASGWGQSSALLPFLEARRRYFVGLLAGSRLITQAIDPRPLQEEAVAYASAYQSLLRDLGRQVEMAPEDRRPDVLARLRALLLIDAVTVQVHDPEVGVREAALLGPTHPLRALWFITWAALAESWLGSLLAVDVDRVEAVRVALLERLTPAQVPPLVSRADGRALTAFENVNFFWTLYVPPEEPDPRGLADRLRFALGAPAPAAAPSEIAGGYLATRVARYLRQHPYVRRLRLNAFNPGRGAVIADMLLQLQREFSDVSYDLRLFVPEVSMSEAGADVAALRTPEATQLTAEADAFSRPGRSHMDTKLALAVRATSEFVAEPAGHSAHVSLLFDVFSHHEVGVWQAEVTPRAVAPIHGLWQGFRVEYMEDDEIVAWHQRPRHGKARDLPGFEGLTDLMSELPEAVSAATVVAITGQTGSRLLPEVTLALGAEDRSLIHQLHEVSDWVITVDRNLGVEFFDHGGRRDRPDFLIDHSPDLVSGGSRRLVVTSRSLEELEAMFCPVLAEHGLPAEGPLAAVLFDQLRFLSGRLGFKLISAGTQRREALGLALARLYLDYQGVLEDQLVIPLDAHPELYRRQDRPDDAELGLQRTDFAIFDLDAGERLLTCRLVEVKCHAASGEPNVLSRIKGQIVVQLERSRSMLAGRFDPELGEANRPDRSLEALKLSALLDFYLNRAVRYGIFDRGAELEARALLDTLEQGYRVRFTKSALVFDLDRTATDAVEVEDGVEYHLVGRDSIRRLIESAWEQAAIARQDREGTSASLAMLELGVSRRETAAFLAPPRDRSLMGAGIDTTAASAPAPQPHEMDVTAPVGPVSDPRPAALPSLILADVPEQVHADEAPVQLELRAGEPDVLLGTTSRSPQWGILGEAAGRTVGLDLNETHTLSLFGVQGGGKSYTLGSIVEMATVPVAGLNHLPRPLATVIFHYSPTQDYAPEFTSMIRPNDDRDQVRQLAQRFGASPAPLSDVVLVVPDEQVEQRRAEHPELSVHPLKFAATELHSGHWRFLMGAVGNQSVYIRQVNRIMRERRRDLTLATIRNGIEESRLPEHLKELAKQRLDLAASYVDDAAAPLANVVRPGRLVIVDLRDEFIERDEALGLFVVLLQLFAGAQHEGVSFNKLVVFDEAHKYIDSADLVAGLVEVVREMRHKGTSVMIASQDPPSVPIAVIELSSQIILHRFNSPMWLRHVQKANAALAELSIDRMTQLAPGEAFVWSSRATDDAFSRGTVKVRCRPRITRHGGQTRRAFMDEP